MNSILRLILPFSLGVLFGFVFYGGLWWTLSRLAQSEHPALLAGISFVLRAALVVYGFYLVVEGEQWQALAACITGFLLMRLYLLRHLGAKRGAVPT